MYILSSLKKNQTAVVRNLYGGQRFISRVSAMGFTLGVAVTMVQNNGSGPVLVYLRDTQVALGAREASLIEIERR